MGGEFGLGDQPRDWYLPGKVRSGGAFTFVRQHSCIFVKFCVKEEEAEGRANATCG